MPPMTPAEIATMQRMIDGAVSRAVGSVVQPMREELDQLQNVDRRHDERLTHHSGAHHNIVDNVRKSISDIRATTNEDLLAAQRHFAGTLDAFRREMTDKVDALATVPQTTQGAEAAAVAGAHAATAAKAVTTIVADDTTALRSGQARAAFWANVRMVVQIILIPLVGAIAGVLAKTCAQ